MRWPLALAFLLSSLLPSHSVEAQETTGGALAADCQERVDACKNYLLGVWDGAVLAGAVTKQGLLCLSGPPTGEQLRLTFNKWAANTPEHLNQARGYAAMEALLLAYACK